MNEKLTAYALGELPPEECKAIEAQLESDPSFQKEMDETRSFCHLLEGLAVPQKEEAFTTEERSEILRAFRSRPAQEARKTPFWRHPFILSSSALAACLTFIFVKTMNDGTLRLGSESEVLDQPVQVTASKQERVQPGKSPAPEEPQLSMPGQASQSERLIANNGLKSQLPEANFRETNDFGANSAVSDQALAQAAPLDMSKSKTMATADAPVPERAKNLPAQPREEMGRSRVAGREDKLSGGLERGAAKESVPLAAAAPPPPAALAPVTAAPMPSIAPDAPVASPAPLATGGTSLSGPAARDSSMGTLADSDGAMRDSLSDSEVRNPSLYFLRENRTPADSFGGSRSDQSGEAYAVIQENAFIQPAQVPLSTFSIDVDTASYANVRRFLNDGQRPPANAVRLEELINYFPYTYEEPAADEPFGVAVDMAEAPWQPLHRLVRIAIKGKDPRGERGPANFVFLVDISGSMDSPDKLPLVKQSLRMLVDQLRADDRVAIVTYAGESGVRLESTPGTQKEKIIAKIDSLSSGGSTNGESGIRLAYEQAQAHFQKGGVNRVVLCTDGDFNVGISDPAALEKLIAEKAKSKVFLSVLGYGTGNLQDRTMETLADKGNGNYAYIDSASEARKVLVDQMQSTMVTIAKDVKIQVEFNPSQVAAYRLVGYENRLMAKEDFNNDRKDAGEIGAGHSVTALYEIVPANVKFPNGSPVVDKLKYAQPAAAAAPVVADAQPSNEIMTVKLRYKEPEGDKSSLVEMPVLDSGKKLAESSQDFQFAAGVAGFGLLLRGSEHAGELTWDMVRELAVKGKGQDPHGYRGEFLQLIEKARAITGGK